MFKNNGRWTFGVFVLNRLLSRNGSSGNCSGSMVFSSLTKPPADKRQGVTQGTLVEQQMNRTDYKGHGLGFPALDPHPLLGVSNAGGFLSTRRLLLWYTRGSID